MVEDWNLILRLGEEMKGVRMRERERTREYEGEGTITR